MSLILSALCIGALESEWAPLPSQGAAFYGGSKEFQRADFRERFEILWGTVNRRREAKQRHRSAQGAAKAPKQCPIPEAERSSREDRNYCRRLAERNRRGVSGDRLKLHGFVVPAVG